MTGAPEGRDLGGGLRARHARLDALLAGLLGPVLPTTRRGTFLGWGGGLAAAVPLTLLTLSGEAFALGAFGFIATLVTASGLHHCAGVHRTRVRDSVTVNAASLRQGA